MLVGFIYVGDRNVYLSLVWRKSSCRVDFAPNILSRTSSKHNRKTLNTRVSNQACLGQLCAKVHIKPSL